MHTCMRTGKLAAQKVTDAPPELPAAAEPPAASEPPALPEPPAPSEVRSRPRQPTVVLMEQMEEVWKQVFLLESEGKHNEAADYQVERMQQVKQDYEKADKERQEEAARILRE